MALSCLSSSLAGVDGLVHGVGVGVSFVCAEREFSNL